MSSAAILRNFFKFGSHLKLVALLHFLKEIRY